MGQGSARDSEPPGRVVRAASPSPAEEPRADEAPAEEPPAEEPPAKEPAAREPAADEAPAKEPAVPGADVAAPFWLTQLLKSTPAPIDWKRAFRAAAAIAAPIAVGMIIGQIALGALVSIGALCGTVTSISGPYRDRARRSGFSVLAGGIGFFVGDLAGTHGWWTVVLIVVVAAGSAVISAAGNIASLASLQLLVQLILGTHESTLIGPWVALLGFAVGAAWSLFLSLAAWPVRATAPERALVAQVFDDLADLLSLAGSPDARPARHRLTTALNRAYDALLSARSRLQGRDEVYRRLFLVLSEATPAVEATVGLVLGRHRPPASVIAAVRVVAEAIRADEVPDRPELPTRGSAGVLALTDGLAGVFDVMSGEEPGDRVRDRPTPTRPSRRERLEAWFDQVLAGPTTWLHALRLALCMAIGEVLTMLLPFDRSYWLALTIAIVLKPDFGSVFARALLRGGGTLVGALVGAGVLAINPNGWVLVALAAGIAFLLPIAQVRQYGMFATVLTPLVIIQLELGRVATWDLVLARLVDTLVACGVVLIFGYLLWPGSRTPKIGGRVADAVGAVARYADRALRADPRGRSTLRRRTYRQLADLRTEFQRMLVEPSAAGRLAAAWYPAIIGLERLTGSVTRVAVAIDRGGSLPAERDVDRVVAALTETGEAVREQRRPPDPPDVASPRLAGVVGDLGLVVSGLRGPDLSERRPLVRRLLPRPRPS